MEDSLTAFEVSQPPSAGIDPTTYTLVPDDVGAYSSNVALTVEPDEPPPPPVSSQPTVQV